MDYQPGDSPLDTVADLLERHEVFERDRKRNRTRALALLLHHHGLSTRDTATTVTDLAEPISRTTVSNWTQRAEHLFREQPVHRHREVAVDETRIHLRTPDGSLEERFLWAAVDPVTGEVVHIALTESRGGVEALGFLRGMLQRSIGTPHVHVDGGPWYPWALDQAGAPWSVTSGGARNIVEAWFGALKQRLEAFHRHLPVTAEPSGVLRRLKGFAGLWNRLRLNHP